MKKKHILFLSYNSLPELTNPREKLAKFSFTYDILLELKKRCQISVIDFIRTKNYFVENEISYYFQKKTKNKKLNFHIKTHLLIRKISPDVIYLQGLKHTYLLLFLVPLLKNKPKIIIQHRADKIPSKNWKKKLLSYIDQFIDAYIFTSFEMGNEWVSNKIINSQSKIFTQLGLSTYFKYDSKIVKEESLFIWVARLNKNKDPETIIKAFCEYLKINSEARLIMFYSEDDMENEIKELLLINRIENQIQLLGKVKHEELEIWYQKSTYFILGSHYEGGSVALIEAMACGCIPIVSDIPANRAMTNREECAILFKVGSKEDLLEKLKSLNMVNHLALRKSINHHFETNISFQALSEGINNIIKKLYNK